MPTPFIIFNRYLLETHHLYPISIYQNQLRFSPITLVHAYLKKVTRKRIFSGPFQGLYYIGESIGSSYYPKILGIYEKELHGILVANRLDSFDKLVVIGAGEGYYAVGLVQKMETPGGRF